MRVPFLPLFTSSSSVLLALSFSTLCQAQTTPPATTQYVVTATQVKPDMLNEWLDLQKNEVNPAMKKAGITQRAVSVAVLGNTYEYISISPLETFAVYDLAGIYTRALGAEAGARLVAKLRKCVDGSRSYVILRVNELTLAPDASAPPPASVTVRRRMTPGKGPEYEALVKADLLPVMKKAKAEGKIAGYVVSRRNLGANTGETTFTTYYNKFADINGGPILGRMVGQETAAKLAAKATGLSTIVETIVRRRVADLSY